MTWQNQCSRQFLDFIIYGLEKWFEIFTIRFDTKGEMIEMRSLQISNLCLFVWASNGRNRLIFLFIVGPKSQNYCTIFALYRLSKLSNNLLSLFASFVVEENIFIIASSLLIRSKMENDSTLLQAVKVLYFRFRRFYFISRSRFQFYHFYE